MSCTEPAGSQKAARSTGEPSTALPVVPRACSDREGHGVGAAVWCHGRAVPSAGDTSLKHQHCHRRPHRLQTTSAHLETDNGFTRLCHAQKRRLSVRLRMSGGCKAAKGSQAPPRWHRTNVGISSCSQNARF